MPGRDGYELQVTLTPAGEPRAEAVAACDAAYTAAVVREASPAECAAMFDKVARRLFKVSGDEWLARYDNGDYRGSHDSRVTSLEMLLPFVRSA